MKSAIPLLLCLGLFCLPTSALASPVKTLSRQQPALQADLNTGDNLSLVLFLVYMKLEQQTIERLLPSAILTRPQEDQPRYPAFIPIPDMGH